MAAPLDDSAPFRVRVRFKAWKLAALRRYFERQVMPVPPKPRRLHDGPPVPYPQTWTCPRCGRVRPMVDALYCQECSGYSSFGLSGRLNNAWSV